jgi:hypothetical protein
VFFCFLFGLSLGGISSAGELAKTVRMGKPVFVQNIAPGAADAVKVVDAFSSAIKAVKLSGAERLLDSKVLILASGSSERSRSEYMEHHAIADPIFMQNVHRQLRYRQTQAEGNLAWVATKSELNLQKEGRMLTILGIETIVLKRTDKIWRITHIHWSSHTNKAGDRY